MSVAMFCQHCFGIPALGDEPFFVYFLMHNEKSSKLSWRLVINSGERALKQRDHS
jgi:hypothetical protein